MSETTALAIAQDYPQEKFNLLIPVKTMQELSPLHKLVINEVQISPDPGDKDVYKEKNGEFALHKRSLMKLMAAANIQVIDSRPVPTQKCNKCYEMARATKVAPKCFECPYQDDVAFQVTIAVPEPSGNYRMIKATKEIRVADAKESMTDAQFKAFFPFRTEQCESKALNRALREGLMIKSTYKAAELNKPFVVGLVMPNMSDPDLKAAMIEKISNNAAALYGGGPAMVQIAASSQSTAALPESNMTIIDPNEPDDVDMNTGEVTPPGEETIDITPTDPEPPDPESDKFICGDCKKEIKGFKDNNKKQWTAKELAEYTEKNYGRRLCRTCLFTILQAAKAMQEMEGGQ